MVCKLVNSCSQGLSQFMQPDYMLELNKHE
jgi:hypothetical protein